MADVTAQQPPHPLNVGDKPLPHNNDAEIAVLGCMLLDPQIAIDIATTKLHLTGCFHNPAHQRIFTSLVELADKSPRGGIDLITLTDALEKQGTLQSVGGAAYLSQLMSSVPTAANVEQYVDIVLQNAILRGLIRTTASIQQRCFSPQEDIRELLDTFEQEVLQVTGMQTGSSARAIKDMIFDGIRYLDRLQRGERDALGLQTGFEDLDRLITGFRPGEMLVLAARPSIGKTAFALNIAAQVALRPEAVPVGFFSLEMSAELLVLRVLCSEARISLSDIREGALSAARWQEVTAAGQRLRAAPIYIDSTGGLDVLELRARARRMHKEHGIQLLVVDYLQLLRAHVNRNATRENEVARMSGGLKALAKELNIPVLVLAQLNRQAEQAGQQPRLSHLRESGAIEQDADVVALLHRERDPDSEHGGTGEGMEAELIIAKNRNGPTGIVPLTFIAACTRFQSRARIADEDVPEI